MAKKSAAKFEIADKKKYEPSTIKEALQNLKLPPIEDVFEKQKKGMISTIEIQIRQDSRFDTMMAVRETYLRFYRDEHEMQLHYAKEMCDRVKEVHELIKARVEDLKLEEVVSEDFTNPCDEFVTFDDPDTWEDVFEQSVLFAAVQPYGQAFDDLHSRMMEEAAKREEQ